MVVARREQTVGGVEQVQQREQENPHQVDKVPIQADVLDHAGSGHIKGLGQQDGEGDQSDNDVDRMETGDQEVGAGPQVAAGDHNRQLEPGIPVVQTFEVASRGLGMRLVGDQRELRRREARRFRQRRFVAGVLVMRLAAVMLVNARPRVDFVGHLEQHDPAFGRIGLFSQGRLRGVDLHRDFVDNGDVGGNLLIAASGRLAGRGGRRLGRLGRSRRLLSQQVGLQRRQPQANRGRVVDVGLFINLAARQGGVDLVSELLRILVPLHAQKHRAEQEGQQQPALCRCGVVAAGRFEGQHDRDARSDQDGSVDGAPQFHQMDVMGGRPGGGAKAEHDVGADKRGEEHDFRGKEQPKKQLAVGQRQRRLVFKTDVVVVGVRMIRHGE
jgi:hypothetical protein